MRYCGILCKDEIYTNVTKLDQCCNKEIKNLDNVCIYLHILTNFGIIDSELKKSFSDLCVEIVTLKENDHLHRSE